MKRKLKIGKYIHIAIEGFRIVGFDFTKFIRIELIDDPEDKWKYELEIWGNYRIKRFGKTEEYDPTEIQGFKVLLDFSQEVVKSCEADKAGNFWLETELGNRIEIEDGPFENWQFKIYQRKMKVKTQTQLIGGAGSTQIYEMQ